MLATTLLLGMIIKKPLKFDFHANIYGEHVKIEWIKRLRGEVKFSGVDELIAQLKADEQASRKILAL